MSRKSLVFYIIVLIAGSVFIGTIPLALSAFFLLDLEPDTRQIEFAKYIAYGVVCAILIAARVLGKLRPVFRLLLAREQNRQASQSLLQDAQEQALTLPNRLIFEIIAVIVILMGVSIYVDVVFSGYELEPTLINAALSISFILGIGLVINIGLRVLLHSVLTRISIRPQKKLGRFSLTAQITLMLTLVCFSMMLFIIAFTYSQVANAVDESIAGERARWLQETVLPIAHLMSSNQWTGYLTQLARPGEEIFLLNREGLYVGRVPTQHLLTTEEEQKLAQSQAFDLYKRDYSFLRVVSIPFDEERVLCMSYTSQASTSLPVQRTLQALVVFVLVALAFAFVSSLITGQGITGTIRYVVNQLQGLAQEEASQQRRPIAQTSLDEMGDLVQAFNQVQNRTNEYTNQLQVSVSGLQRANEQRQLLLESMIGLTAPVIPVSGGLVIVLLSGYFDQDRATHIRPNLLQGVADYRAQIAIIDMTAVAEVSKPLTSQLGRAIRSVMLMGCKVVLTGVSADVAWAMTQTESGLETLPTRRDLEDGLTFAHHWLSAN